MQYCIKASTHFLAHSLFLRVKKVSERHRKRVAPRSSGLATVCGSLWSQKRSQYNRSKAETLIFERVFRTWCCHLDSTTCCVRCAFKSRISTLLQKKPMLSSVSLCIAWDHTHSVVLHCQHCTVCTSSFIRDIYLLHNSSFILSNSF